MVKITNSLPKNSELSAHEVDVLAWDAICRWPALAGGNFVFGDIDFGHLTRWFLWDKVSRAVRRGTDFQAPLSELELCHVRRQKTTVGIAHKGYLIRRLVDRLFFRRDGRQGIQVNVSHRNESLLYVPVLSDRLYATVQKLIQANVCRIMSKSQENCITEVFRPKILPRADSVIAEKLHQGMLAGLGQLGIWLEPDDVELLRKQVIELTVQVDSVRQELLLLKPNAILMHGDNHPPFQAYVLLARKMRIPTIMLQHGLDCEHYCLDEAYASHIAVWGSERERRYRDLSAWQPEICVTGNPEFDHLSPPEKMDVVGDYWLWVTRPHIPRKCYLPSRLPREGVDIFHAILTSLLAQSGKHLVVKPHPYECENLYYDELRRSGLGGRVTISSQDVQGLIESASVVISEDSTAGMEAMFFGKVLIHAHFAKSKPTMPFVDYGAALPGFDSDMLQNSLFLSSVMSGQELTSLLLGQRAFIEDFAGPCDGKAGERALSFVESVLNN